MQKSRFVFITNAFISVLKGLLVVTTHFFLTSNEIIYMGNYYIGIITDLLPFLLVGTTKCENDANAGNTWVPACDKAGSYIPGQCNQAIGSCWCVDRLGREIPRTREVYSKGRPRCDLTGNKKVIVTYLKPLNSHWDLGTPPEICKY